MLLYCVKKVNIILATINNVTDLHYLFLRLLYNFLLPPKESIFDRQMPQRSRPKSRFIFQRSCEAGTPRTF
jgi:hypothetical protein